MQVPLVVCFAAVFAAPVITHAEPAGGVRAIPYRTGARFAALSSGSGILLLHTRLDDGAVCLAEVDVSGEPRASKTVVVHAPVAGPVYPQLTRWRDRLVASFFDSSERVLYFGVSAGQEEPWKVHPVEGLQQPNGWHDIVPIGESLDLLYASERRGVLMRSRIVLDSGGARAGRTEVVDDGAVSKGGANLSHQLADDDLLVVYNGAYHGFGQGKSLKLARSIGDGGYRIYELDGPGCSVGNSAATTVFRDELLVLSADRTAAHLYTFALDQPSGAMPVRRTFAELQGANAITACGFCRTRDECVAVVQRWPQLVVRRLSSAGVEPPRTFDVGQRFSDDAPGSDLVCVWTRGQPTVLYYDPVERSIRALSLEPAGDTD